MEKTYTIGNLEVYRDLLGEDTFRGAIRKTDSIGKGWRLPDSQELLYILSLSVKYKVGGYSRYSTYWSRDWEMGEAFCAIVWSNSSIQLRLSPLFTLCGVIAVRDI